MSITLEGEIIQKGRPPKYSESAIKKMLDAFESGATRLQVCKALGISRKTLWAWAKEHPEFGEAYEYGKMNAQIYWENVGKSGIFNPKSIDSKLYVRYMEKNFADWRPEKSPQTQVNAVIKIDSLPIDRLTNEQLEAKIQEKIKLLGINEEKSEKNT